MSFLENSFEKSMSDCFEYLPEELVTKILLRLPVKTIGQCKCVQKRWNCALSNSHTVQHHLSKSTETKLLIQPRPTPSYLHGIRFETKKGFACNLDVKSCSDQILGSCRGLVLIQVSNSNLLIINPTTKKCKKLTPRLSLFWEKKKQSLYGLGFNRAIDDYCVVEISWYKSTTLNGYVSQYLLTEHRWNAPVATVYKFDVTQKCGILVEEALHWLAKDLDDSLVITAYSVSDEEFKVVPAPSNGDVLKDLDHKFIPEIEVIHECLGLITGEFWVGVHVWVMKRYGVAESWTQLSIVLDYVDCEVVPVGCPENCLIVKERGKFKKLVFNGKEVTSDTIEVLGLPAKFRVGRTWIESLVPLTAN